VLPNSAFWLSARFFFVGGLIETVENVKDGIWMLCTHSGSVLPWHMTFFKKKMLTSLRNFKDTD